MGRKRLQVVIDAVSECADAGMTRQETAKSIGLSYQTICFIAKDEAISFNRGGRPRDHEREADMLARFHSGETLQSIGDHFGITRERVRQIVERNGAVPRYQQARIRRDQIVAAMRGEWLTSKELADRFGIDPASVLSIARDAGIKLPVRTREEEQDLAAFAERVKAGESIRAVSGGDHNLENRIKIYCAGKGIKSLHGPWRDLSHRYGIIRAGREAGKSWKELALEVSAIEKIAIKGAALYNWAQAHIDDIPQPPRKPRRAKRPARPYRHKPAPAKVITASPDIVVKDTVKETAIANRDRATASQIAAAIGVSRNSIIGHWNRARISGELPA